MPTFTSELSLLGNEIANISGVLYIVIMEFVIELQQINLGSKNCNFLFFKIIVDGKWKGAKPFNL
jgi:hypothetical protein